MQKILYNIIGFICIIAGIIGIFVPLWPTTVFVIIASIVFGHANPKMQAWLLKSKWLGPYLQNYKNKTGIAMPYKIRTAGILWSGLLFSATLIFGNDGPFWLYIILSIVGISVSWHVFAIRNKEYDSLEYPLSYNMFTVIIIAFWIGAALFFASNNFIFYSLISLFIIMALPITVFAYKTKSINKKLPSKIN